MEGQAEEPVLSEPSGRASKIIKRRADKTGFVPIAKKIGVVGR